MLLNIIKLKYEIYLTEKSLFRLRKNYKKWPIAHWLAKVLTIAIPFSGLLLLKRVRGLLSKISSVIKTAISSFIFNTTQAFLKGLMGRFLIRSMNRRSGIN
ncbi:MAG: hypothetical protein A3E87_04410 [Gammaproteobacteria bacterium RIFCSPHIGHO2_12_FULL_35_23]|nr:MAG: hypothetical protein A3E87_04410 [Gammaproteobacteria bacterium RIFCSPHIGHO2_12_FULL_35_23]